MMDLLDINKEDRKKTIQGLKIIETSAITEMSKEYKKSQKKQKQK